MQSKIEQHKKAIELRKQGLSYKEILEIIPVAKSSLSLWLKNVNLTTNQKQRLTDKKLLSALKGATKRKETRIQTTKEIKNKSRIEIGELSERDLWLIGTTLYWGEGTKQKDHSPSSGTRFCNSDPYMIIVFLKWIDRILKIPTNQVSFEIYIHENHRNQSGEVKKYWSNITKFPIEYFSHIYFKKNKISTKRKNIGVTYKGLLRVKIKNSTNLNRKIAGWIEGIYNHCGVV